jgi:hypothetical protein
MNTDEEALQARRDYIQGANGFEGAPQWNSFIIREDEQLA